MKLSIALAFFLTLQNTDLDAPSACRALATNWTQTGKTHKAQTEWEEIVVTWPHDGSAWIQLALSAQMNGELDAAVEAYEQAVKFPAVAAQANYNLAGIRLNAGHLELAKQCLAASVSSGFNARNFMANDPDFTSLRGQAFFQDLLDRIPPIPPINPGAPVSFLEQDVQILWTYQSDNGLDRFGWQSESIGDLNQDGVAEILVGGPNSSEAAKTGGKAWVLSGKDGSLLRTHVGTRPGQNLGFRCKPAGDLNQDGTPDYMISAPGANSLDGSVLPGDAGLDFPGSLFIYSGSTGEVMLELVAQGKTDRFGFDAAAINDLDGDGMRDLLVGAPGADLQALNAGQLLVFSGRSGKPIRSHFGARELDRMGSAVGVLNDLNGDDFQDYVVGVPGAGKHGGGQAMVYSGKDGALIHRIDVHELAPEASSVEFGRFFASSAGDLDGDKIDDIYIADCFDQSAGLPSGRLFLISGSDGELVYSIAGTASNNWYGIGRSAGEDYNHDGIPDLILGALASNDGAFNGGRIDLRSGRDGTLLRSFTSTVPHLSVGYDTHPVGDVDGDKIGDFFATASWGPWAPQLGGRGILIKGKRL